MSPPTPERLVALLCLLACLLIAPGCQAPPRIGVVDIDALMAHANLLAEDEASLFDTLQTTARAEKLIEIRQQMNRERADMALTQSNGEPRLARESLAAGGTPGFSLSSQELRWVFGPREKEILQGFWSVCRVASERAAARSDCGVARISWRSQYDLQDDNRPAGEIDITALTIQEFDEIVLSRSNSPPRK